MKKRTKVAIAAAALLLTLYITIPDSNDFYDWLASDYRITQKDDSLHSVRNGLFKKENVQVQEMFSHHRHMGLLMSMEKVFQYENGDHFTIRTVGIMNQLIPMEDGWLWEWLS